MKAGYSHQELPAGPLALSLGLGQLSSKMGKSVVYPEAWGSQNSKVNASL